MINSVAQLCERLEIAGEKTVELEEDNHVEFNNAKDETIVFTRKRKLKLEMSIVEAIFTIWVQTMRFNMEATR